MIKSFQIKNTLCVLVLCALIMMGVYIHSSHQIRHIQSITDEERNQVQYYQKQRKRVSLIRIHKKDTVIEHKVPNLEAIEASNNNSINKGLNLAFNHCHTSAQFSHNKMNILNALGLSTGQKVLNVVKPIRNSTFKQPTSSSDHILWSKIGYGPTNNEARLPVTVVLEYETPVSYAKSENGTTDSVPKYTKGSYKVLSKSKVVLDLDLNVHSKQLTYNQGFQVGANDEQ